MTVNIQPSIGLKDSIERCYPVQKFRRDAIPEVILEEIFRLGVCAPSAYNLQPWRFVVLRSPQSKETLKSCTLDIPQITQAPIVLICCGDRNVANPDYVESIIQLELEHRTIEATQADIIRQRIAGLFEPHTCFESVEAWTNRNTMLAVAHFMIVAKGFGVDNHLVEEFSAPKVKEAFNIPDSVDVCCLLCLGYAQDPYHKFGGRFSYHQVCYGERYGQAFQWDDGDG